MMMSMLNEVMTSDLPVLLAQDAAAPAGGAEAPGGMGIITSLVPFILIFVIMYFLIIRPQQKRMKAHREMVENVRRGDEVITQGGFFAKITRVKEGDAEVEAEIAEGVKIRLVKSMIADVVSKTEPVANDNA